MERRKVGWEEYAAKGYGKKTEFSSGAEENQKRVPKLEKKKKKEIAAHAYYLAN